jgi:hypothetical protein
MVNTAPLPETQQQRTSPRSRDESGVALILALVFIVAIATIFLALGSFATGSLVNTQNLKAERAIEYAADGATTLAVQNVRYSGNPYASAAANCLPNGGSVTLNNIPVWVVCTQQSFAPLSGVTRVINFYACGQDPSKVACTTTDSAIVAQVSYDDYATNNTSNCTSGGVTSTCGSAMTINSWVVQKGNA